MDDEGKLRAASDVLAGLFPAVESEPTPCIQHSAEYVYFIQTETGPVKIGLARNPRARLADLQVGNHEALELVAAMPGDAVVEAGIHALYEDCRIRGEWFSPNEDLLALIERHRLPPEPAARKGDGGVYRRFGIPINHA